VTSEEPQRTSTGHTGSVNGCAFSPDGQLALSTSWDQTLRLWDVMSGQTLRTFEGHTGPVDGCAFSPDGQQALSASGDDTLRLWDVASGQEIAHWRTDTWLYCCALRSDGHLAMAGGQGIHFLEVVEIIRAAQLREPLRPVTAARLEAPKNDAEAVQTGRRRGWWPFGRR
jgi:WD40 repeat protein